MTEPIEPIVGVPEEMAQAIAIALSHIQDWRQIKHARRAYQIEDLDDWLAEDEETINLIEEALESYNEL